MKARRILIRILSSIISNFGACQFVSEIISSSYNRRFNKLFRTSNCWYEKPIRQINGANCIKIGQNCRFGRYAILSAWEKYGKQQFCPSITIGDNCSFGDYVHITCISSIYIGGTLTGRFVTITDNAHGNKDLTDLCDPPVRRQLHSNGPIVIQNNVWIGDKVTILPNVIIGEGAVIGANSVVTKNIPPFSIAAGNPAKIIKTLKNK